MNKFRAAIASMRLRTLPLSTGGVILGILLATADFTEFTIHWFDPSHPSQKINGKSPFFLYVFHV